MNRADVSVGAVQGREHVSFSLTFPPFCSLRYREAHPVRPRVTHVLVTRVAEPSRQPWLFAVGVGEVKTPRVFS